MACFAVGGDRYNARFGRNASGPAADYRRNGCVDLARDCEKSGGTAPARPCLRRGRRGTVCLLLRPRRRNIPLMSGIGA